MASTNTSAAANFGSPAGKAADPRAGKMGKFKSQASTRLLDLPVNAHSNNSSNEEAGNSSAGTHAAGNPAFAHPADYFTAESLHERMKMYAQQGGIPLDYLDRYAAGRGRGNTASSEQDDA